MDCEIDVITTTVVGDIGFHFKVRGSENLFWVVPARWPAQPRFWCFRVSRCTPGGLVDTSERSWIGAVGMTRDELPAASQAIRADVGGWLAQQANQELRRWILQQPPPHPAMNGLPGWPIPAGPVRHQLTASPLANPPLEAVSARTIVDRRALAATASH